MAPTFPLPSQRNASETYRNVIRRTKTSAGQLQYLVSITTTMTCCLASFLASSLIWHSSWHPFCFLALHLFHSKPAIYSELKSSNRLLWSFSVFWHVAWSRPTFWHLLLRHVFLRPVWHLPSLSTWQVFWHQHRQFAWHWIGHAAWHLVDRRHLSWHGIWQIFWQIFWHFLLNILTCHLANNRVSNCFWNFFAKGFGFFFVSRVFVLVVLFFLHFPCFFHWFSCIARFSNCFLIGVLACSSHFPCVPMVFLLVHWFSCLFVVFQ